MIFERAGATVRNYCRELLTQLCPSLVPCWRTLRWRGLYMCASAWGIRAAPFPVAIDHFGVLTDRSEFVNFIGNVCGGELRNPAAESLLRSEASPLVIDVGVNIGVTVRWWLSQSPRVKVIGLDMMEEAVDFTSARVAAGDAADRWLGIVGAVGSETGDCVVRYDDPLEGTTSLGRRDGGRARTVAIDTLDGWLSRQPPADVTLLKVDVEGSAADVFAGAGQVLARTAMVVFEGHHDREIRESSSLLFGRGFHLAAAHGRNFWWIRTATAR